VGAGAGIVSLQQVLPATSSLVDPSIETSGSIEDGNGDKRRPAQPMNAILQSAHDLQCPITRHEPESASAVGTSRRRRG